MEKILNVVSYQIFKMGYVSGLDNPLFWNNKIFNTKESTKTVVLFDIFNYSGYTGGTKILKKIAGNVSLHIFKMTKGCDGMTSPPFCINFFITKIWNV